MPITRRVLTSYTWYAAFEGPGIKVMKARENGDVAIIHSKQGARTKVEYSVFKRRFTSPSEAVKYYNFEELARSSGRRSVAGSPEQIAARKSALP